ncbi:MAG: cytochrome c peroxidase [Acidobacteriota bacterium]
MAKTLKSLVIAAFALAGAMAVQADGAKSAEAFRVELPLGVPAELWSYFVPKDNPLTREKVEIGRQLFFDRRLSADGSISCASCHDPQKAFADGKKVSEGVGGKTGERNSPSILNAMFNSGQFWDGRAETLEAQAILPLINPVEMGDQTHQQIVERLEKIPEYARAFREVFGSRVTIELVGKAIAAFERTLVSANSPFDRYTAGDRAAMSEAAVRGSIIFRTKGRCTQCHAITQAYPFFSDQIYRNTGVAAAHSEFNYLTVKAMSLGKADASSPKLAELSRLEGASELGRYLVTGNALDVGAFRTPSLRNVELTAPYFHNGSAATLLDVVKFYVQGGNDNPMRAWELMAVDLTDEEQSDLVEFLKALTSDDARRKDQH